MRFSQKLSRSIASLFALFIFAGVTIAADPPAWVRQAAAAAVPGYDKEVKAVVLLDEQIVTLDSAGKLITRNNYVVKILAREGRGAAVAAAPYLVNFGKISDLGAWIIRPNGTNKAYGKESIVDRISDPDDVYDEGRVKIISARDDVDTGFVFAYTYVSEELPLFFQDQWAFQGEMPVISSRYVLNLPTGWKASSITFNHADVKPQVNGSTFTWELRNLAPIADEPMSPSFANLAPRIAVNYAPDGSAQSQNRVFTDWTEVSRWATAMYDPQVIVDDNIAAKARELTATSTTEFERIQAIGKFVQDLQYISIDIGVGYGNGYKPRSSTLVLARGYGDCKDKATLMRALLKAIKIEAFPVVIYSGDPSYVRAEWASPRQFNHCIIAVRVSDATKSPTVVTSEKLGRLLMFDATDQFTPVGDLPDYLQGSSALVIAGENGKLMTMPVTPAEVNAWKRTVTVDLTAEGGISGTIKERATGQEARYPRTLFRSVSGTDFNNAIERWLTRGATAARLVKLTPNDRHAAAAFDLDVEFTAPQYGQLMQNRLLVFKPAIVNRADSIYLTEKSRKHPVVLDSNLFTEDVTFTLPAGFTVDEMPDAVTLETPFGKYSTKYETKDNKLVFSRSLKMNRTTVAVDKYETIRDFYSKILAAEQAPVVLVRK